MVVLRPRIPKDSKAAPAPVSLSKRRQAKAKKIREEGAVNGKIRKRCQRRNLSPTRKCPFDTQKAYADQCDRCAVTTLNHFNQLAASNMGVTYELVKAGRSTGFMHREQGLIFHCKFLAKPIKCSGDSETVLFFGEFAWEIMVMELVALTYIIPQRDFTLVKSNMVFPK
ncbi:hypothetical protein Cgig2_018697 [Carnegiea gigantea]|uniref:DUF3615 domain-containing protein n=1 Tax=Carnegiea gigantea TaxID=171969 RepID=A0A9Q1KGA9_9CARY|nr:hypothetical protein Cgig2_018697 [Carnegiea gigantea]